MKAAAPILFVISFTLLVLSSCGAVETVFKPGMEWAFFLVGLVIVIVLLIATKL